MSGFLMFCFSSCVPSADESEASLAPANLECPWMVTSLLMWPPFRTSSWPPETSVVQVWGFDLLRVINNSGINHSGLVQVLSFGVYG